MGFCVIAHRHTSQPVPPTAVSVCPDIGRVIYALLHQFHILHTNTDSPGSPQMPCSFQRKILYHDSSQRNQLCIQWCEDAMIREIETVGDLPRDEVEVFVGFEGVRGCRQISCINSLQPLLPSFKILRPSLPFLPAIYQPRLRL